MASLPYVEDSRPQTPRIDEQIAEVRRELALRRRVYPEMIRAGKLKRSTADYSMHCMESVLTTLEFVRCNRAAIVAAVIAQGEGSQ